MKRKRRIQLDRDQMPLSPRRRPRLMRPLKVNPTMAWSDEHTDGLLQMGDRILGSPVAWLKTKRRLFDGRSAVEVCGSAEGVRRALVVHTLSLDMDPSPEDTAGLTFCVSALTTPAKPQSDICLFTATIVGESQGQHVQIFSARLIDSAQSFRHLLEVQFGSWFASEAIIQQGFDPSEPIANSLLSEATADYLTALKNRGFARQAAPFEFHVEQRFPA
jgi:hypothetical protein